MKRLAILCALACALVACDEENKLAMIDDTENPNTPSDTIDPNTPTASFYTEVCFLSGFPRNYGWLCIDSTIRNPIAKYGKIWLLDEETGRQIAKQRIEDKPTFFGSYINPADNNSLACFPSDETYFDNPNDIFNLFENGTFSAIRTIDSSYGFMKNVPFGEYYLLGSIGVPHGGTIKSYQGSIAHIRIDSTSSDTIKLHCVWRNSGHTWLSM